MYKVYKVAPQMYYNGMSLVAADSAEEANSFIADFKIDDGYFKIAQERINDWFKIWRLLRSDAKNRR